MKRCTRICAMNDPDKGCLLGLGDNCTVGPDKEYQRPAEVESGSVREKLVELIRSAHKKCKAHKTCHECEVYGNGSDCVYMFIADHLLANGVTIQEWIPVTERLPKEQGFYRVYHKNSKAICDRFYYKDCPDLFVNVKDDPVTHWKPIEQPPKGE